MKERDAVEGGGGGQGGRESLVGECEIERRKRERERDGNCRIASWSV